LALGLERLLALGLVLTLRRLAPILLSLGLTLRTLSLVLALTLGLLLQLLILGVGEHSADKAVAGAHLVHLDGGATGDKEGGGERDKDLSHLCFEVVFIFN
jgi:hypothetical protein